MFYRPFAGCRLKVGAYLPGMSVALNLILGGHHLFCHKKFCIRQIVLLMS
jgi:hypothetical protein